MLRAMSVWLTTELVSERVGWEMTVTPAHMFLARSEELQREEENMTCKLSILVNVTRVDTR